MARTMLVQSEALPILVLGKMDVEMLSGLVFERSNGFEELDELGSGAVPRSPEVLVNVAVEIVSSLMSITAERDEKMEAGKTRSESIGSYNGGHNRAQRVPWLEGCSATGLIALRTLIDVGRDAGSCAQHF